MLFFRIRKDPFNGFFAFGVKVLVFRGVSGVIGQIFVVLPNMAQDSFYAVFRVGAKLPGGTLRTNFWIAAIFPVTVPVGGTVGQEPVFRADHAVIVFIINILPPLVPALQRHGTLVGSGQHPAIVEHFFADMWSFVGGIRHNSLNFWKTFGHFVVDVVERHAVVDIAGGDHRFQHIAILLAGGMGLIGKLPLMFSLHKHTAIRVCGAFRHRFEACLLPPRQLLFRGVVPLLFRGPGRIVVIIEGLFPVGLPVCVDLRQQLIPIPLCRRRHLLFDFLVQICAGFDVRPIDKHCRRRQCPRRSSLIQHPLEYPL